MIPLYALWMLQGPAGQANGAGVPRTPPVVAVRAEQGPELDGRLDDAVWALASPVSDLVQQDPDEGKPGSERTEVRLVYDGAAHTWSRLKPKTALGDTTFALRQGLPVRFVFEPNAPDAVFLSGTGHADMMWE